MADVCLKLNFQKLIFTPVSTTSYPCSCVLLSHPQAYRGYLQRGGETITARNAVYVNHTTCTYVRTHARTHPHVCNTALSLDCF